MLLLSFILYLFPISQFQIFIVAPFPHKSSSIFLPSLKLYCCWIIALPRYQEDAGWGGLRQHSVNKPHDLCAVTYSPEAVSTWYRGCTPPQINLCMEILITIGVDYVAGVKDFRVQQWATKKKIECLKWALL